MNNVASPNLRLGAVSFLNSRPLLEGLDDEPGVRLESAVPAALPDLLARARLDAALIPVIDLARSADPTKGIGPWERVGNACIACSGDTRTVRVFSRAAPEDVSVLYVDGDSHTSVALARILWRRYYDRPIEVLPLSRLEPDRETPRIVGGEGSALDTKGILLIGDKVVTCRPSGFEHEIDLGGAWKSWTGLPFVFAVWAAPAGRGMNSKIAALLEQARDRGVERAEQIAQEDGPRWGWPVDLATDYLTRKLVYTITPEVHEGMRRFLTLAAEEGLITGEGARVA